MTGHGRTGADTRPKGNLVGTCSVESRCGALAIGSVCLLPGTVVLGELSHCVHTCEALDKRSKAYVACVSVLTRLAVLAARLGGSRRVFKRRRRSAGLILPSSKRPSSVLRQCGFDARRLQPFENARLANSGSLNQRKAGQRCLVGDERDSYVPSRASDSTRRRSSTASVR